MKNSVGMELKRIEPGSFMMGSETGFDDEKPVRSVAITKAFLLARCPVTQSQWARIMGTSPSNLRGPERPVEMVSWNEACEFCRRLSEREGIQYRLPTEAEWEYACRAGSATQYFWGDDVDPDYACADQPMSQDVGSKKSNAWGLHDMAGGVWEWCHDWLAPYPGGDASDPKGPDAGTRRVHRGGGWINDWPLCTSAVRDGYGPDNRNYHIGFRVAADADQVPSPAKAAKRTTGQLRILYVSKSDFQHPVVRRIDGEPSHTERVLADIAERMGATLVGTKDARLVNARDLQDFDVVVFYTQGDLTKPGGDGNPPMGPDGVADLRAWVENGGGFVGFHSATDTLRTAEDAPPSPYCEMVGAEFRTHGKQFVGTVHAVDAGHPAMAHVPDGWRLHDEWYAFHKMNTETMHVLALLDPGDEFDRKDQRQRYDLAPYPIVWCRSFGKGRVYYNAIGHREDVWLKEMFQKSIIDAITWARGDGPAQAEPNYAAVVPGGRE
jgi:type 1 glutamine amidotransferase